MGVRKHLDGPFVYAQKEDAGVEAVPVLGGYEVDVWKLGWWKESCPGNHGVQDDGVGVEPAVRICISSTDPFARIYYAKSKRTELLTRSSPPAAHKA